MCWGLSMYTSQDMVVYGPHFEQDTRQDEMRENIYQRRQNKQKNNHQIN